MLINITDKGFKLHGFMLQHANGPNLLQKKNKMSDVIEMIGVWATLYHREIIERQYSDKITHHHFAMLNTAYSVHLGYLPLFRAVFKDTVEYGMNTESLPPRAMSINQT